MATPDRSLSAATEHEIDRFLDDQLVEYDAPGASLAVFDAEGVVYATGLGARTLDPVAPATPDSQLHVASVTKSFTAIALLQLAARGALSLDDAVGAYVDFLADAPGDPVTVEDLLTHTSGIPSDFGRMGGRIANRADFVRRVDRWAGERVTDRRRLAYYNGGYVVLGGVVAAADGRPYAEYVTEEILDPLGMDRSTFDQDPDGDVMTGYAAADGDLQPSAVDPAEFPAIREGLFGVGGLISSVTDLTRVVRCVMAGGALDGERLLSADAVASMTGPQSPPWPTVEDYDVHFGHGWLVEDLLDDRLVYAGGSVAGYNTFAGYLRERELGVALGINRGDLPKNEIGKALLAIAAGEDPGAVRWIRARRAVDAVTGTYETERPEATATVRPGGGGDRVALDTTITVSIDDDLEFRVAFEEHRPDGYLFTTTMGDGHRWVVEFVDTAAGTTMLWSRGPRTIRFDRR